MDKVVTDAEAAVARIPDGASILMGGFVEKQVADVMRALVERDEDFARLIIERDKTVNRMS